MTVFVTVTIVVVIVIVIVINCCYYYYYYYYSFHWEIFVKAIKMLFSSKQAIMKVVPNSTKQICCLGCHTF